MPVYRISGLTVDSEMQLPGVVSAASDADEAEVCIRKRYVPDKLNAPVETGVGWELDSDGFLLRVPDVGRIMAVAGRTLDLWPEPGVSITEAMPFLLGTGWGAILSQRGFMILHASAVSVDGEALAVCGPSGAGKSTTAAALCAAGASFVCDDIAAAGVDSSGVPVIWPDGRCLKLFDNSIEHLRLAGVRAGEVRSGSGKHYVEPPGSRTGHSVPLRAVYVLRAPAPHQTFAVEKLNPLDAAQTLLTNSYRRRLTLARARTGQGLTTNLALLNRVPVFHLYRHSGLEYLKETTSGLMAHWRTLSR